MVAGALAGPLLADERPNVLLITLDTVRADHLGSYGSSLGATPNLDRLARESLRFEHAVSPVPLTRPAHTSLLTGLYPNEHGVRDNLPLAVHPSLETVAERLRERGYRTGGFVGSFLLGRGSGLEAGFDVFSDGAASETGDRVGASAERKAPAVTADARHFLAAAEPPFFAWVHFYDPHAPYDPPPPYADRFGSNPYAGEIAFVDAAVGELLDALRGRGLEASTLVLVTADHGEGLGEHGEDEHGVLVYEETLRVPLLMRHPGRVRAGVSLVPVSLVDVAPTILDAAGVAIDASAGLSLLRDVPSRPLYFESLYGSLHFGWAPLAGIRESDMKLIYAPRPELYDLASDPDELDNVANDRRDLARRLFAELERARARGPEAPPSPGAADLDKLASLGYVGTASRRATGADPKDEIAQFSDFGAKLRDAVQAFHGGDCERAIPLLAELAERDILSFEVHLYLARCHRLSGELGDALREYEAATAIYDAYAPLHLERGLALLEAGEVESAAPAFEASFAIAPSKRAALGLGAARRRLGELEAAVSALQRARDLDPDDPDTWNELGALFMMSEDPGQALPALRRAIALRPDDTLFRHNARRALAQANVGVLRFESPADAETARARLLAGEAFDAVAGSVHGATVFSVTGGELAPELLDALVLAESGVSEVLAGDGRSVVLAIRPLPER